MNTVLPLLLLLLRFQDNSQLQAEIGRLQGEVQKLSAAQTAMQNELRPICSSESRLQAGTLRIANAEAPVRVNMFAMASNPSDACLPADIRITATYFDPMDLLVCSGTVTISQSAHVQNTSLEFRPYELEVFLKWWDGATLKQQALLCRDYQGNEMRNPTDFAASLRVYASVFPKRGGLSTSEIQINLPRFQRP